MEKLMDCLKIVNSAIGAFLGWYFGGLDGFMYAFIVLMIVDYITGVTAACMTNNLSSKVGFRGIAKKVLQLALVGVANIIDKQVLRQGEVIRDAVIFFYIANEGLSIIENVSMCGVKVPTILKKTLKQIREQSKEGEPTNGEKTDDSQ